MDMLSIEIRFCANRGDLADSGHDADVQDVFND